MLRGRPEFVVGGIETRSDHLDLLLGSTAGPDWIRSLFLHRRWGGNGSSLSGRRALRSAA